MLYLLFLFPILNIEQVSCGTGSRQLRRPLLPVLSLPRIPVQCSVVCYTLSGRQVAALSS